VCVPGTSILFGTYKKSCIRLECSLLSQRKKNSAKVAALPHASIIWIEC